MDEQSTSSIDHRNCFPIHDHSYYMTSDDDVEASIPAQKQISAGKKQSSYNC